MRKKDRSGPGMFTLFSDREDVPPWSVLWAIEDELGVFVDWAYAEAENSEMQKIKKRNEKTQDLIANPFSPPWAVGGNGLGATLGSTAYASYSR